MENVVEQIFQCPLEEVAELLPKVLKEEPLALLLIASRISERGAMPPLELVDAFSPHSKDLQDIPTEKIVQFFTQILLGSHVEIALEWLLQTGFMLIFYPEIEATKHLQQETGRHHKDVWEHTKLVVKQAVKRPAVRWAALLHDIGKVPTRRFTNNGVTFHGHAEVGARMFDKVARRMPLEEPLRRKVHFLIKYHLRSAQYEDDWSDSAVRRFSRDMEEHLVDLLDLSRADITSKRPGRRKQILFQISALSQRIDSLRKEDAKQPNLPKGLGDAIMQHFGIPPSKRLGDLMKILHTEVDTGALDGQQEFSYYLDWLAKSGLLSKA